MAIREALLQVSEYSGEGYRPLVDYGRGGGGAALHRRAAAAKHRRHAAPRADRRVFVLLRGNASCYRRAKRGQRGRGGHGNRRCAGGGNRRCAGDRAHPGGDMQPFKLYNVPARRLAHPHPERAAEVLVIENRDTCDGQFAVCGADCRAKGRTGKANAPVVEGFLIICSNESILCRQHPFSGHLLDDPPGPVNIKLRNCPVRRGQGYSGRGGG